MYPACNAHAQLCVVLSCPVLHYFSTLSHKHYDPPPKKKLLDIKCVLIPLLILSEKFLILRRSKRYRPKCLLVFVSRSRYSCQILTKTECSRHTFETYSNFTKIHPVGKELFCGDGRTGERQTERQDEASRRFSRCCESG